MDSAPIPPLQLAHESLHAIRALIPQRDVTVAAVSAWSVGEQIHHAALVARAISERLDRSGQPAPRTLRSLLGQVVLWRNGFPRGRAKAPSAVLPASGLSADRLNAAIDQAGEALVAASALPSEAWVRHFILGIYRRDDALRFVAVHTRHHLAIARDIITAA